MSDLQVAERPSPLDADKHDAGDTERPAYGGMFERYEHGDSHNAEMDASTGRWHALGAVTAVFISATLLLTGVFTAIGLVITHYFVHSQLGRRDERISVWFAHHRTGFLNSLSLDLTKMADAPVIVGVVVVVTALLLFRRWGRFSSFLAFAIVMELIVFELSEHVVARPRPHVVHVGVTPPTFSWPSGHTAAALVTYVGLALIVTCATRRALPRILAWTVAVAMTLGVAWSRVYEGEHHLSDVIGGLLLGVAALYAAVLIMRAWGRHSRRHPSLDGLHRNSRASLSSDPGANENNGGISSRAGRRSDVTTDSAISAGEISDPHAQSTSSGRMGSANSTGGIGT